MNECEDGYRKEAALQYKLYSCCAKQLIMT